jgi:hypothetical protein
MSLQEVEKVSITILMDNSTDFLLTNSAHAKRPSLIVNERFNLPPPVAEHGFSALINIVKDTKNKAEKISSTYNINSNTFLFDTGVSENGIFTDAESSGNRINSNNILRNTVDLNNANGLDIDINQNRYSDNNCEISNPGALCTTATSALQREHSPGQSTQEQEQNERKDKLGQKEESQPSITSSDRFQTRGIDWMPICTFFQSALYPSCNLLVDSDGTLTDEGDRAFVCIRNGAALAFTAGLNEIPLDLISRGLQYLEGLTGCGGIVNWNKINDIASVPKLLNLIPLP